MRLDTRISLRRITVGVLGMGWALSWASVEVLRSEPNLVALPWLQILVGVAIASWGGATATLGRYLAASYESRPFHWRTETVRDGFVSVTVGGGSYFSGWWYGLPPMLLGLVLLLAGYLGVRILSGAAERLLAIVAKP
jgi:hypothetical protein